MDSVFRHIRIRSLFFLLQHQQTTINTMKFFVVFALAVAVASAAPNAEGLRTLPALQHEEVHDELGQYSLRYVTAEGTIVSEKGHLIPSADGGRVMVVEGEVTYIGDDGNLYTTKYTAGLDGYKAEGSHLPVAPVPLPVV